jgi:hypothetical protein
VPALGARRIDCHCAAVIVEGCVVAVVVVIVVAVDAVPLATTARTLALSPATHVANCLAAFAVGALLLGVVDVDAASAVLGGGDTDRGEVGTLRAPDCAAPADALVDDADTGAARESAADVSCAMCVGLAGGVGAGPRATTLTSSIVVRAIVPASTVVAAGMAVVVLVTAAGADVAGDAAACATSAVLASRCAAGGGTGLRYDTSSSRTCTRSVSPCARCDRRRLCARRHRRCRHCRCRR